MMTRTLSLTVTAGVFALALSSCSKSPPEIEPESNISKKPSTEPAANAPAATKAGKNVLLDLSKFKEKAPEKFKASFKTSKGEFIVDVTRTRAPLGADRFYNLVKHGYYNDCYFFRAMPGFVIQFGITGNPKVNNAWRMNRIKDDPVKGSNKKGELVFATSGKDSRTTQLFINIGENSRLDAMGFAPFGTVSKGMDVVEKITTEYGQRPNQQQIHFKGNAYLKKNFPNMDRIITAKIVRLGPAARAFGRLRSHTMY